jgi:fatty-acid desaturase
MKNYKYLFTTFFPLHILCLVLIFFADYSLMSMLYFLLGYIFIGGLGVAIGLHRWASHRSLELKSFMEPIVIYASLLSCQGHPIWWAAVHRGYHHRHSDTEKDEHSPMIHGKWHAFLGWIIVHDPKKVNYKYAVDLLKDQSMVITAKYYELIIYITWIVAGLISLEFLLWFFIIPAIFAFHGEGLINTFCHGSGGYKNFDTNDNSKNIPILGLVFWGNGWHNNHHHKSSSFDFGKSVSGKKNEFDPCTVLLPLIRKT